MKKQNEKNEKSEAGATFFEGQKILRGKKF